MKDQIQKLLDAYQKGDKTPDQIKEMVVALVRLVQIETAFDLYNLENAFERFRQHGVEIKPYS